MDKKLQDLVWSILPKEFKEEVKKYYQRVCRYDNLYSARGATEILELLFGKHNLTSDAEGEEMLMVSRKKVQELYAKHAEKAKESTLAGFPDIAEWDKMQCDLLQELFGSKCLPDEESKPEESKFKFKVGDKVKCRLDGKIYKIGFIDKKPTSLPYQFENGIWASEHELELYTDSEEVVNEGNFTKSEPVIGDKKPKYKTGDIVYDDCPMVISVITEVLNTPWGYIYCLDNQITRIYEKVI